MSDTQGGSEAGTSTICPRCGARAVQVFYGPCATCRDDLVAKYRAAGRGVVVEDRERVHRTPNFVATRD